MTGLGKTAWVDRALSSHWDALAVAVPPEWRPRAKVGRRGKVTAEEFGCGHYGCVMPTSIPGLVVKLTTDPSEAAFVQIAMELGQDQESGLVLYRGIYALPGAEHRNRQVYVLWREEAFDVGSVESRLDEKFPGNPERIRYEHRSVLQLFGLLSIFKTAAADVRERAGAMPAPEELARWSSWAYDPVSELDIDVLSQRSWEAQRSIKQMLQRYRGAQRIALALRLCAATVEVMQNTYACDAVGNALDLYLEQGLLLADVHTGNIGRVARMGMTPVITDPGHAVVLDPRWLNVGVPALPSATGTAVRGLGATEPRYLFLRTVSVGGSHINCDRCGAALTKTAILARRDDGMEVYLGRECAWRVEVLPPTKAQQREMDKATRAAHTAAVSFAWSERVREVIPLLPPEARTDPYVQSFFRGDPVVWARNPKALLAWGEAREFLHYTKTRGWTP